MRIIDFLSQSPNNYIFQRETNKTTFGGLLSLIYLIFALFIFLYYIVEFTFKDKYEITSFISRELHLESEEEENKFMESDIYNPILKLKFSLLSNANLSISDRFILYDAYRKIIINRDEIIERRVTDINFYVLYKCLDNTSTCDIDEEDIKAYYKLDILYQGFVIDPQDDIPIKLAEQNHFHQNYIIFNPDIKLASYLYWDITRFEDNKGLFEFFDLFKEKEKGIVKEKDIYVGGKLRKYEENIIHKNTYSLSIENHKLLLTLGMQGLPLSNVYTIIDYKRKKKSILDSFANMFSLWILIYNGLTVIFSKLYSKNFDKYKIIENILLKKNENFNNKKEMKIMNDINISDSLLAKDTKDYLGEINDITSNEKEDGINDDNYSMDKENEQGRILPRLKFIDFIFNSIYKKKCCFSKKQEIISACNNIILKYYSVENILFNQFMMENLLRDYNWNNPELKFINSNNSFTKIKNLIN